VQQTKRGGFRRLAIVCALATAGVLTVGAHAAFAQTGTLEICKSSANGMSGRTFEFSINGGSTITVRGGRCSGPFSAPAGAVSITELVTTPATEVDSIVVRPSQRNLGLTGNTARVTVVDGSTAANETRITFTNVPGGGATGDLKICKLTDTPAFVGHLYTFHVNGGPAVSVEANSGADDASSWSCLLVGTFTVGTVVSVKEDIPAGQEIAFIDSDPPDRLVDFDTNTGVAHYLIGSGVTVALYDNEAVAPSGTGFIEVCKDAANLSGPNTPDPTVAGVPFDFTIDEPDQSSQDITVLGGQCSGPIVVAAGVVRVTEHPEPGFSLVDVFTIPNENLLDSNLTNGTADVEVAATDSSNFETQVHFVNEHQRGQLKLCKALGPSSSVLAGMTFNFEVDDPVPGNPDQHVSITANAQTQCKIVDYFPIGSTVEVDESLDFPGAQYIRASGPGCAYDEDGDLECEVTINPGINTLTVTNTALGKLEICKFVTGRPPTGAEANHQFIFRIDGGSPIRVRAGFCSPPQLVSVGDHTVTEGPELNYELDPDAPGHGIVVTPSAAEVNRNLLARSVTVTVLFAGDPTQIGQETRVDFYNRRKLAQIKVCKHITPGSVDSLGGKTFDYAVFINGVNVGGITGVGPEECKLLVYASGPLAGQPQSYPVINPDGTPVRAAVREFGQKEDLTPGGFHISDITVQGAAGHVHTQCTGTGTSRICTLFNLPITGNPANVEWDLGPGTNTAHFTNTSNDP
jgi:hypothetical protein